MGTQPFIFFSPTHIKHTSAHVMPKSSAVQGPRTAAIETKVFVFGIIIGVLIRLPATNFLSGCLPKNKGKGVLESRTEQLTLSGQSRGCYPGPWSRTSGRRTPPR